MRMEEVPPQSQPVVTKSAVSTTRSGTRRRKKGLCRAHPVSVQVWERIEWLAFLLLIMLGMYAIGGISGNVENLKSWTNPKYPGEPQVEPTHVYVMIAAQDILLVGSIFGIICLFLRRDLIGFILAFIFLVVPFIILLCEGCFSIYSGIHGDATVTEMLDNVKGDMKQKEYATNFHTMEQKKKCCGVRGAKDYGILGEIEGRGKGSLPESCCAQPGLQVVNGTCVEKGTGRTAIGSMVNKVGCGRILFDQKYWRFYVSFLVEAILVMILLFLLLLLLARLFCIWRKNENLRRENWEDPREQENDLESAVIPGTPKKSYISDLEDGVFYAP